MPVAMAGATWNIPILHGACEMRFVSRGGTEPRRPQPRALNELTTTLLHVARKYFFITTSTGRRVGEAVSHPRVIHGYGAAGNLP